jgi:hypothetical protein
MLALVIVCAARPAASDCETKCSHPCTASATPAKATVKSSAANAACPTTACTQACAASAKASSASKVAAAKSRRASRTAKARRAASATAPAIPAATAKSRTPNGSTTPYGTAGLKVAIDPETGAIVAPSPEQSRALSLRPDVAEGSLPLLKAFDLHGGGQGIRLDGRYANVARARVDASGRLIYDCANPTPAAGAASDASPPQQHGEEK